MTKNGGGEGALWRAILTAWGHDWDREERGKREEDKGFYRGLTRQGLKALIARNQEEQSTAGNGVVAV